MYAKNPNHDPDQPGVYTPYFYQSGAFLRYGMPGEGPALAGAGGPYARYDFSSDQPLSSRHDHQQTVEQIIAHGYLAVPIAEPETAILADKEHADNSIA